MRNLKRALSLTLASVMLLGMMVLGTSAAGYPDVDDNDNVEAIEVLQAVGVMSGSNSGNFNPDSKVSRIEMAIVMANLLNLDVNYFQGQNQFSDVPEWASGYVNACAASGIVTGVGGGRFGTGNVTATQAALMMLKALGYFQYNSDFGSDWARATALQASKLRLFDGINAQDNTQLTRNQVAQLALNTLKTPVVEPDDDTLHITTPDGTTVSGGNVKYVVTASDKAFARAIDDVESNGNALNGVNGAVIELGEKLYDGKLELRDDGQDDFNRPARTWLYNGQEIGSFMKAENIRQTYTTAVSYRTLYDLLGRTALVNYGFEYYVDGKISDVASKVTAGTPDVTAQAILNRTNNDVDNTGKGVLTQVFVDVEKEVISITSINTYLAKATSGYSTGRETAVLEIYTGYDSSVPETEITSETVALQDVDGIESIQTDDYLLVRRSGKDINGYKVVDFSVPTLISDATVTEFSRGTTTSDEDRAMIEKITADQKYDGSKKAHFNADVLDRYNQNLLDNRTYDIYLDNYGYAIGVDIHEGVDNYVFITGYDRNTSAISTTTADAAAIFLDGTMATIKVNVKDSDKAILRVSDPDNNGRENEGNTANPKTYFATWSGDTTNHNRWYTYTVDKNNVYTLTPATRMFTVDADATTYAGSNKMTIKCNQVRLDEKIAVDGVVNSATPINQNTPHPATSSQRAYGNDDSIYLVAELGTVSQGSGKVITGVDGRYTGVQKVEIDVRNRQGNDTTSGDFILDDSGAETQLYDSVYTLYDKNNYIIASVIIGDAKGTSTNYAYILGGAKTERKIDDNYYWDFEAIVGGEIKTLTVESKFRGTIDDLKPAHIQELRFNGEYVSAIRDVDDSKFVTSTTASIVNNTHEVWDVGHVSFTDDNDSKNDYECKITGCTNVGGSVHAATNRLHPTLDSNGKPNGGNNKLRMEGNTMYTQAGNADWGLTFVNGAKAVVIQPEYGKNNVKTEWPSVKEAIAHLADPFEETSDLEYYGRIVAILDSRGVAQWVVFISDTELEINSAGKPNVPETEGTLTVNLQYKDTGLNNITVAQTYEKMKVGDKITITVPTGYICVSHPTLVYTVPAVAAGQTVISDVITFEAVAPGSITQEQTVTADQSSAVSAVLNPAGKVNVKTESDTPAAPAADEVNTYPNGQKIFGTNFKAALESAIITWAPGIHHYTAALQDALGWDNVQPLPAQIAANQNPDSAVILVTKTLGGSTAGYTLYLDNEEVASGLWTGVSTAKYLAWDEIPVGTHTYKLVDADDDTILQAGTFTMTATVTH